MTTLARDDGPGNFRSRELDELLGILSERRPAVVLLCGGPGMGKTELLREFELRGLALGWEVLGGDASERLPVDRTTSERSFQNRVLSVLPDPMAERAPAPRSRTQSDPNVPLPARLRAAEGPLDPFVDDLSRAAPLLLLIDDYRPSLAFARWFEARFLASLTAAEVPIVVTVAQRPGARALEDLATHTVDLDPLDPDLVRDELRGVLAQLDPPADPAEQDVYASEANTPVLLDSLVRVLALAKRPEVGP